MENIDYDALKKRGFLRQKQEGFFILRARMGHGVFKKEHLDKLADISARYGRGFVHATTNTRKNVMLKTVINRFVIITLLLFKYADFLSLYPVGKVGGGCQNSESISVVFCILLFSLG